MVSALLEIEDCSESGEQATIHGSLGSNRSVSRSPCIEGSPSSQGRVADTAKQLIGWVAVAVAYQHF
jgi:hypothetical protein